MNDRGLQNWSSKRMSFEVNLMSNISHVHVNDIKWPDIKVSIMYIRC